MKKGKYIVHCYRKELWDKILDTHEFKMKSWTRESWDYDWKQYKDGSGLHIIDGIVQGFAEYNWYKGEKEYRDYIFCGAGDYLRDNKSYTEIKAQMRAKVNANTDAIISSDAAVTIDPLYYFNSDNTFQKIWNAGFTTTHTTYTEMPKISMLQKLTNAIKKVLPINAQKQYRAGFRNGAFELTEEGKKELLELLASKFDKEFTEIAQAKITELEAEEN